MKKIILQFVLPFLAGFGVLIAFGLPIGQAFFTGVCAMSGLYIGKYFSKNGHTKKMNKKN
jgi:hypothetical protein